MPNRRPISTLLPLAIRPAIAAFLGIVTTIILAVAMEMKYPYLDFTGYCTNPMLQFTRQESLGLTILDGTEIRPEETPWRDPHSVLADLRGSGYSRTDYYPDLVYNSRDTRALVFFQIGWPVRCFWGWSTLPEGGAGLADFPQWLEDISLTNQPLPRLPLWHGLIINTALFGSIWFTLLFIPGLARRAHRRRRGRCLACGYDLHATPPGQPCPECGKPA